MIVEKLGVFLSVITMGLLVISIVVNIHFYVVINQLNDKLSELREMEFQICGYTYAFPGWENETQERASTVWAKVRDFDEAIFVTSEKNFSVIVYMHPYSVGFFDPSTAEWIVIVSSIPEMTNETKLAIFRLGYQTFDMKKAYKFSYPVEDMLTLEESIAIMEEELTKDPYEDPGPVDSKKVRLLGGNFIYSYSPWDFAGTIIVNRYARKVIFYATTIWDGTGELKIPEE